MIVLPLRYVHITHYHHNVIPNFSGGSQSQDVEPSSVMYDDQDEQLHVHTKQTAKCVEDDDFLAAFDKIMIDSVQQRTNESVPQPDFVVPANAKQKLDKKTKFGWFFCFIFLILGKVLV